MPLFDLSYDLPCLAQRRTMSCWAAAGATLKSWKTNQTWSEDAIAEMAGEPYPTLLQTNSGLSGDDIASFAKAIGAIVEAPQNWSVAGYAALLVNAGPFWAGAALTANNRNYGHVRVVSGIVGNGSVDGTSVSLCDPDGGRVYSETVRQFGLELEQFARIEILLDVELRPQLIHY